jgi:hypothetical protein
MDIGQMAPTRVRKTPNSKTQDDGFTSGWTHVARLCTSTPTSWPRDDLPRAYRQVALPDPPRSENGSVYIRMLYNRNNTTDLASQLLTAAVLYARR